MKGEDGRFKVKGPTMEQDGLLLEGRKDREDKS